MSASERRTKRAAVANRRRRAKRASSNSRHRCKGLSGSWSMERGDNNRRQRRRKSASARRKMINNCKIRLGSWTRRRSLILLVGRAASAATIEIPNTTRDRGNDRQPNNNRDHNGSCISIAEEEIANELGGCGAG